MIYAAGVRKGGAAPARDLISDLKGRGSSYKQILLRRIL